MITLKTAKDLDNRQLLLLASYASVAVAGILLITKLFAWFTTGSLGVLASLVDSLLDLFASLINFIAVRYSLSPANQNYKFGFGKAEALAGLAQSFFIIGSSLFLFIATVERIAHPSKISEPEIGIQIILFSIVLTMLLLTLQKWVISRTDSVAIKAEALHYRTDLFSNGGILLGLFLYEFGWLHADSVVALLISVYIFESAIRVGYQSIQLLLDKELEEEDRHIIETIAQNHPRVIEIHDLRTRQSGRVKFIQLHLVMNGALTLEQAHKASDEVERALIEQFEDADVTIHQDPHTESSVTSIC